jgi:hypothetical protein
LSEGAQRESRAAMPRFSPPSPEPDRRRRSSEPARSAWGHPLVAAAVALGLSLLILTCVIRLWDADLTILPNTKGDVIVVAMSVKSMVENGWWLHNPRLGMPFGQQLFDVPFVDNLSMLAMKLLSLYASNYAVVINCFFFLTFPLTVIISLLVLRRFAISYPSAIVASLLYVFLPYHFFRGEAHLFLSAYYVVPLIVMVCVWLWRNELDVRRVALDGPAAPHISRRATCTLITVLLIGSGENYYAFFACFLLCVAGIGGSLSSSSLRPLSLAVSLSALVTLVVALNNVPSLVYIWHHGTNKVVAVRGPQEAELYGLKISQMLLPVDGHRVPYLSRLRNNYNSLAPIVNENGATTLGAVTGFGFLFLLAQLLWLRETQVGDLCRPLASLAVASVLFGTIGGFGSLFNFLIYAQFRAYNRISIFIAFLSLFATALLLDLLGREFDRRELGRWMWYSSLALVLLVGLLDQTSAVFVPHYAESRVENLSDAAFVKKIEASVPRSAMIFQLPIVPFPTNPPVQRMVDYDLLKGYLHSASLRWSYGSVKGRDGALWDECVGNQPLNWMVPEIVFAGFSGIYIDRYGYSDSGARIESAFLQILGESPIVSDNGRLAFFNLTKLAISTRAQYTLAEWLARHEQALRLSEVRTQCGLR